jgi:hypothetical protein
MPPRRYTLRIHLSEPEVFYFWTYDPPVTNCFGGMGHVNPGGTLHGISYDALKNLGEGEHAVEFDETVRCKHGRLPPQWTEDDVLFRHLRLELFVGKFADNEAAIFCILLLAMTPRNAGRILPLLSDSHLKRLRRYAGEIAESKEKRDVQDHSIFSSSGSRRVPDENLETIRRQFGNL